MVVNVTASPYGDSLSLFFFLLLLLQMTHNRQPLLLFYPPSVLTKLEYKLWRKVKTEVMSHHVSKILIVW